MLIAGIPTRSRNAAAEDLHVAGQHEQLRPARQQLHHRAPRPPALPPAATGTWWKGTPAASVSRSRSGWFEITATISVSSSPRRAAPEQVEQAVVVARDEDRRALALAPPAQLPLHLEALARPPRGSRSASRASRPSGRKNSVRRKKRPPLGSEEYWCEETMLASCANRKPETAATIPGRSGAGDQQPRRVVRRPPPTRASAYFEVVVGRRRGASPGCSSAVPPACTWPFGDFFSRYVFPFVVVT